MGRNIVKIKIILYNFVVSNGIGGRKLVEDKTISEKILIPKYRLLDRHFYVPEIAMCCYYGRLYKPNKGARIAPKTNPPACAQYAIPPLSIPILLRTCKLATL